MHVQTGSTFNFVRSHSEKTNSKLPALIFGRVNFLKKKKKKESKIKQVITSFYRSLPYPYIDMEAVTMMSPVQCKLLGCLYAVFSLEPEFSHI